jgi:hypothetical protein
MPRMVSPNTGGQVDMTLGVRSGGWVARVATHGTWHMAHGTWLMNACICHTYEVRSPQVPREPAGGSLVPVPQLYPHVLVPEYQVRLEQSPSRIS